MFGRRNKDRIKDNTSIRLNCLKKTKDKVTVLPLYTESTKIKPELKSDNVYIGDPNSFSEITAGNNGGCFGEEAIPNKKGTKIGFGALISKSNKCDEAGFEHAWFTTNSQGDCGMVGPYERQECKNCDLERRRVLGWEYTDGDKTWFEPMKDK